MPAIDELASAHNYIAIAERRRWCVILPVIVIDPIDAAVAINIFPHLPVFGDDPDPGAQQSPRARLLVDLDLHRPDVHRCFGPKPEEWLADQLLDGATSNGRRNWSTATI